MAGAPPWISLSEWSLRREILEWPPRHLDFPKLAREVFGIEAVEYRSVFFREKVADFGYLADMKQRADDAGVRSVLVEVDGAGPLGSADLSERHGAVEMHFPWIAAAAYLGCELVSVGAEGVGSGAPYLDWTADSLRRLGSIAQDYGLGVVVGNRTGLACDGSWMAALMRKTAHPAVGTHPHLDNFDLGGGRTYPRYQGVEEMMPWAKALSARSCAFDAAGEETRIDYGRMARIARAAGYAGAIGVEYDGPSPDERAGIARTVDLVRRAFAEGA